MIDLKVQDYISKELMPQLNKRIVEGLAVSQAKGVEAYIDETFRYAATSFPPGLTYHGGRKCTPEETYMEMIRSDGKFEMLRSDIYLMRYQFRFNGVDMRPYHLFLPFIGDGGIFYLRGTRYVVTPVLMGRVFNIEANNIYMSIRQRRMGFGQESISCILNNRIINTYGVVGRLHDMPKNKRSSLSPMLLHYMLTEYGLSKLLYLHFHITVKIGKEELDQLPLSEWKVYRSRRVPVTKKKVSDYEPCNIRIAIPEEQYYPLLDSVIGTLFYILDVCPEATDHVEDLENPLLWLGLLDRFVYQAPSTEKKQIERMEEHLLSLKRAINTITKAMLQMEKIACNDIFDLFRYMCMNYQDMKSHHDVGSMYDKELSVVPHLLYSIVYDITIMMYSLQKIPEHLLSADRINNVMQKHLQRDRILSVRGHGEITPVSIATDNKMYSVTCNMISHNDAATVGTGKHSKVIVDDPAVQLNASQVEAGTVQWVTKRGPFGRNKTNPLVRLTKRDTIVPRPGLEEEIEDLQKLLHRNKR